MIRKLNAQLYTVGEYTFRWSVDRQLWEVFAPNFTDDVTDFFPNTLLSEMLEDYKTGEFNQ